MTTPPMPYLANPSTLVKALRASSDPPQPAWPDKASIAVSAWRNDSFVFPRKADVVKEWILDTWTKADTANRCLPVVDVRLHQLLLDIGPFCSTPPLVSLKSLALFFRSLEDSPIPPVLFTKAVEVFREFTFAPMSVHSPKWEDWVEVWTSMTNYLVTVSLVVPEASHLVHMVTVGACNELSSRLGAKKTSSPHVDSLPNLACAISLHPPLRNDLLLGCRLFLDPTSPNTLWLSSLLDGLVARPGEGLTVLPGLFAAIVWSTNNNNYVYPNRPSSSKTSWDTQRAEHVRQIINKAMSCLLHFINGATTAHPELSGQAWQVRKSLWGTVEQWGGYLETEHCWTELLRADANLALQYVGTAGADCCHVIDTLCILERLDHRNAAVSYRVCIWCLTAIAPDSYESALTLLSVLARHFGLTRNPGGWFSIMSEALDVLTAEDVADGSATQDHHELLQGPLGDSALRSQVANMLRSNREHSWGGRVVSAYCDRLSTILSVSRGRGPSHYVQRAAIQMAAGSRLLTLVPGEVLFGKENPSKFRLISITACVWELASASDQVSRDLCTAALLRLDRYFTIRSEVALDHDHLRALLESDAVAAELRLELVQWGLRTAVLHAEDREKLIDALLVALPMSAASQEQYDQESPQPDLAATELWSMFGEAGFIMMERYANSSQLRRLCHLIAGALPRLDVSTWLLELPRMRDILQSAFCDRLENCTSANANALFRSMASLPSDYLSKHTCGMIVLKAITLDITGSCELSGAIRTWMAHANCVVLDQALDDETFINHLLATPSPSSLLLVERLTRRALASQRATFKLLPAVERFALKRQSVESSVIRFAEVLFGEKLSEKMSSRIWQGLSPTARHTIGVVRTLAVKAALPSSDELHLWAVALQLAMRCGIEVQPSRLGQRLLHYVLASDREDAVAPTLAIHFLESCHQGLEVQALGAIFACGIRFPTLDIASHVRDFCSAVEVESLAELFDICLASPASWHQKLLLIALNEMVGVTKEGIGKIIARRRESIINVCDKGQKDHLRLLFTLVSIRSQPLSASDMARILDIASRSLIGYAEGDVVGHCLDIVCASAQTRPDLVSPLLVEYTAFYAIAMGRLASGEHASTFSRGVEALCRGSHTEWAGPLAKHAPTILVAFVRASIRGQGLSLGMRAILEPGLFAICDAITVGGRSGGRGNEGEGIAKAFGLGESSFTASEVGLWADLWRRWNHRRFAGQG